MTSLPEARSDLLALSDAVSALMREYEAKHGCEVFEFEIITIVPMPSERNRKDLRSVKVRVEI